MYESSRYAAFGEKFKETREKPCDRKKRFQIGFQGSERRAANGHRYLTE
ncbi:MAG TPA: hypothetical protein VEP90_01505 [Methylomirabilota bacterium]|nr:hypothetical protein [Methylomirabilota bacterium]